MIARILGVPEDDFPRIKQLAWDFARAGEKTVTPEVAQRGDAAARNFEAYFGDLADRRRSTPGDDLLSSLLEAEADGERLTHTELVANCILLLQAGHETTQDLIGNSQVALFRHPDQLALLREQPELTKHAVEEFLRYDGSVQINHRVALDAIDLDGRASRSARCSTCSSARSIAIPRVTPTPTGWTSAVSSRTTWRSRSVPTTASVRAGAHRDRSCCSHVARSLPRAPAGG